MPPAKRKKKGATSIKTEGGGLRRAYGLFKQRVVQNVPWSVDALESLLAGDDARLRSALKFHTNIDVEEQLRLVQDYEPKLGETVETLTERSKTVVIRDEPPPEEPDDLFGREVVRRTPSLL